MPYFKGTQLENIDRLQGPPGGHDYADPSKVARILPFKWEFYEPIVVQYKNGTS